MQAKLLVTLLLLAVLAHNAAATFVFFKVVIPRLKNDPAPQAYVEVDGTKLALTVDINTGYYLHHGNMWLEGGKHAYRQVNGVFVGGYSSRLHAFLCLCGCVSVSAGPVH